MAVSLKLHLEADLRTALKARDTRRVSVLRMAIAALKQREIDSGRRDGLDETEVLGVFERLIKQRREAAEQFRKGGRHDSALEEEQEIRILSEYLPEPLGAAALEAEILDVIREIGALKRQDMGKVMGLLKARLAGRADMGEVSRRVRAHLPN